MAETRLPPAVFSHGPGKIARVMIWEDGQPVQIQMRWGLQPVEAGGRSVSLLRSEGRLIENRCLIIATDFYLRPGTAPGNKRRRIELITNTIFFCFAGTWRHDTPEWPASFAALTVNAYPDIAPFQDRHVAVVREEDWIRWLDGSLSVERATQPFPAGSFRISGPPPRLTGDLFAL